MPSTKTAVLSSSGVRSWGRFRPPPRARASPSRRREECFVGTFSLAYFDEFGQWRRLPFGEGVLSGDFSVVESAAVVGRSVIADRVAGPLLIIELHIAGDNRLHFLHTATFLQLEVNDEFFLYPAIKSLVDRIVCRLAGTRHGTHDDCIPDNVVVGHGGVDASLVGVEDTRFCLAFEKALDILKTVNILIPVTATIAATVRHNLLCEDIKSGIPGALLRQPLFGEMPGL